MATKMIGVKMSDHDVKKIEDFVDAGVSLNVSDFVRQATREKIEKLEREMNVQ